MRLRLVLLAAPCVTAMGDAGLKDRHSRRKFFAQRGEMWLKRIEGEQKLIQHRPRTGADAPDAPSPGNGRGTKYCFTESEAER